MNGGCACHVSKLTMTDCSEVEHHQTYSSLLSGHIHRSPRRQITRTRQQSQQSVQLPHMISLSLLGQDIVDR